MAEFVKVAALEDIKPGQARTVSLNGVAIAIFNVDGVIHASANTCAHRGGPLGEGTSGACVTNPALRVPCRAVRIEGDAILVEG